MDLSVWYNGNKQSISKVLRIATSSYRAHNELETKLDTKGNWKAGPNPAGPLEH